jgi:hypothetical protein
MKFWKLDDDTYEVDPGGAAEVIVVKVDYKFYTDRGHPELAWFEASLEDGKPANLDKETEANIVRDLELDYIEYLYDREPSF